MSKPHPKDQPLPPIDPAQTKIFADLYRATLTSDALTRFTARTRELNLQFDEDELVILAALNTPARAQEFLNTQIYYNHDHSFPGQDETAMSPRAVLRRAAAHCFEGALFAYAVDFLHGHAPQFALLEASQDSEHNLVIVRDPHTGLYGSNAHSMVYRLDGRPMEYPTIRALAESYHQYYYSDHTWDPKDITLVGYSDPFDLVARYGVAWMGSLEAVWDIYFTYIDDTIQFHYLFDDSGETHIYPLLHAVKENWIRVDAQAQPFISVADFPRDAAELWHAFWRAFDREQVIPRGAAREIEKKFWARMHTTPLDLEENTGELEMFLRAGYRVEQIVKRKTCSVAKILNS